MLKTQEETAQALQRLLSVMKRLRCPKTGCDWDSKQTFKSIMPYTLEETYEVLDAIERGDYQDLRDELGDLLYQIVFYSEMADELGEFAFGDVCEAIEAKLIRRHPHIFTDAGTKQNWEQLKTKERESKAQFSILDDIPKHFPALMRAEKLQKRCASLGFDWDTLPPVVAKVREELDEVMAEVLDSEPNQQRIEEEVGDLLFAVVNLSRHLGQKSELALQRANQKFERRFRAVETLAREDNCTLSSMTLAEMDALWDRVKAQEKATTSE